MHLNNEFVEDVELLALFGLDSAQEGLKIHHDAAPARLRAAQRLFDKKLTTLADGGYLTPLGVQAAEHAQALLRILR